MFNSKSLKRSIEYIDEVLRKMSNDKFEQLIAVLLTMVTCRGIHASSCTPDCPYRLGGALYRGIW